MKMSRFLNENRKKLPKSEKMDVAEHRRQLIEKVIKSKKEKEAEETATPKKNIAYSRDAKLEIKKLERQLRQANQQNIRLQQEKTVCKRKIEANKSNCVN